MSLEYDALDSVSLLLRSSAESYISLNQMHFAAMTITKTFMSLLKFLEVAIAWSVTTNLACF